MQPPAHSKHHILCKSKKCRIQFSNVGYLDPNRMILKSFPCIILAPSPPPPPPLHFPHASAFAHRNTPLSRIDSFSCVPMVMASEGAWRFLLPVAGTIILSAARSRAAEFEPRNFSGVGNNVEFPAWGSVGTTQVRRDDKRDGLQLTVHRVVQAGENSQSFPNKPGSFVNRSHMIVSCLGPAQSGNR